MSKRAAYISAYALCPYYKGEDTKEPIIFCEGVIPKTRLHFAFHEPKRKKQYKIKYCESMYFHHCKIHQMLDTKYIVDDEEDI